MAKVFIRSSCAFEFENPESKEKLRIPREYLGEVPEWVTKTQLYKLAVSGKNPRITTVGNEKAKTANPPAPGISDEEKALRAKAKGLKIPDVDKMTLMQLAVAIDKIENPPTPGTNEDPSKTPPEK